MPPPQAPGAQGVEQGRLVHDAAACRIDQQGAGLHPCQDSGIDEVARGLGERAMLAQHVGLERREIDIVARQAVEIEKYGLGHGGSSVIG